jgi:cytochrome c oxidase cbb3-type subunit 1
MAICALAALIGMIVTLRQADVDSIARGILKMPDQPVR